MFPPDPSCPYHPHRRTHRYSKHLLLLVRFTVVSPRDQDSSKYCQSVERSKVSCFVRHHMVVTDSRIEARPCFAMIGDRRWMVGAKAKKSPAPSVDDGDLL